MGSPETIQIDMSKYATGINTIKDKEPSFQPSPTALHEAGHTLVGVKRNVGIAGVDIIPKGNALGVTYPDQFDAPTTAAGFATGTGGESHDRFITEEIHGQSFGAAALIASVILMYNQKALMDLGRALDTHKSLSRGEIYSIVENAEKKDENDVKETRYEVFVKSKDGKEEREIVVLPEGQTMINVSLPQSGDIFVADEKELSLAR